jgi:uncharacterized damage-inducible protein DinB
MKMAEMFSAQLEREAVGTRRALERVPDGRNDWKPHEKSMPLGYLAALVASMPSWVPMTIDKDELDLGSWMESEYHPRLKASVRELVSSFDEALVAAQRSLASTTDEHLLKPWRFAVGGRVVQEQPRHHMLADGVISHLAHHRGQLTVYLRLLGASVPAIYGPSADEGR